MRSSGARSAGRAVAARGQVVGLVRFCWLGHVTPHVREGSSWSLSPGRSDEPASQVLAYAQGSAEVLTSRAQVVPRPPEWMPASCMAMAFLHRHLPRELVAARQPPRSSASVKAGNVENWT